MNVYKVKYVNPFEDDPVTYETVEVKADFFNVFEDCATFSVNKDFSVQSKPIASYNGVLSVEDITDQKTQSTCYAATFMRIGI